jgi:putative chitinase
MPILFDRKTYFDTVRDTLFYGKMSQQQVDGQEFILDTWEDIHPDWDIRWLAYSLATTIHETASTMAPIEEYGKGKGQPYGVKDPVTGEAYYGRGFVQLTWKENYTKMTPIIDPMFPSTAVDLVKHAAQALIPEFAAAIMFEGMQMGLFRSDKQGKQTFARYFDGDTDDPYGAREIINGDKTIKPDWSNGVSIGNLIKGYHNKFLSALQQSMVTAPVPEPIPEPGTVTYVIRITVPAGVTPIIEVVEDGQ